MRFDHSAESSRVRVYNIGGSVENFDVTGSRHSTRSRKTHLLSTMSVAEGRSRLVDLTPAQATSASDAILQLSGSLDGAATLRKVPSSP